VRGGGQDLSEISRSGYLKFISLLIVATALLASGCVTAKSDLVVLSDGQEAIRVKGRVLKIAASPGIIELKTGGEGVLLISLSNNTLLTNLNSVVEIREDIPLEIVYSAENKINRAIAVRKLQEGQCD